MTSRTVHLRSPGGLVKEATFVKPGTAQGAVALLRWGSMHTLYRFSTKDGKGKGPARIWTVVPGDLPKLRDWVREML